MDRKANGAKMRKLRGTRTAAEVAEAVGVSVGSILMYEQGYRVPRDDVKEAIAEYYGVTVGWLFFEP